MDRRAQILAAVAAADPGLPAVHAGAAVAFATWQVLRRLRRHAEAHPRPRTYTCRARRQITAAIRLLAWLAERHTSLRETTQADLDTWLAGGPETYQVRDFLGWAGEHGHSQPLHVPPLGRHPGATPAPPRRRHQRRQPLGPARATAARRRP